MKTAAQAHSKAPSAAIREQLPFLRKVSEQQKAKRLNELMVTVEYDDSATINQVPKNVKIKGIKEKTVKAIKKYLLKEYKELYLVCIDCWKVNYKMGTLLIFNTEHTNSVFKIFCAFREGNVGILQKDKLYSGAYTLLMFEEKTKYVKKELKYYSIYLKKLEQLDFKIKKKIVSFLYTKFVYKNTIKII
ncbi:TPA: hypothetical protein EYP66_21075, partial [Candidatus Poribacteria bacterium]|nr:hypothetical protein [Candidatus Poribacteria bacterium]